MKQILIFTTILLFLSSCRTEQEKADSSQLPPISHEKVELDPALVKKGGEIYNQMCLACHQPNGAGKAGFAPRLNSPDFLGLASNAFIKETILEGRPGTAMIGYKALPDVADNVDAVVAYIRSWQNDYATFRNHKVDWKMKLSGDTNKGRASFRTYCASCHGPNGGGYSDGGSGPGIGLSGFLSSASDDYIKKTIEIGRAGTAMRSFGHGRGLANISDKEINNIVVYLRSLEE